MNTLIIAISGKMHSGKSTVFDLLVEKLESVQRPALVKFAQPLYQSMYNFQSPAEEKNRPFLQELGDLAKKHYGENILEVVMTRTLEEYIDFCRCNILICDDVRCPEEHLALRRFVEERDDVVFHQIYVHADDETRRSRNPELFVGTGHRTETRIEELRPLADFIINNTGPMTELRYLVNQYVQGMALPALGVEVPITSQEELAS